jgi:hypothetical protein
MPTAIGQTFHNCPAVWSVGQTSKGCQRAFALRAASYDVSETIDRWHFSFVCAVHAESTEYADLKRVGRVVIKRAVLYRARSALLRGSKFLVNELITNYYSFHD